MNPGDTPAQFCADFLAAMQRRGVSFRRAEGLSGWGKSTIAAATRGPGLPNVDLVTDVLAAIGVEPADVEGWRARHEALRDTAPAAPPEPERGPPTASRTTRRRIEIAVFVALLVLVVGLATALVVALTRPPVVETRTVVVQNKVAIGEGQLVEDRTPSYLGERPVARCANVPGCKIPGTEVGTGATLVAVCQLTGESITNADLTSTSIGQNPNAAVSELWLGARAPDGRVGYISEVYLAPPYRGGLGLPPC